MQINGSYDGAETRYVPPKHRDAALQARKSQAPAAFVGRAAAAIAILCTAQSTFAAALDPVPGQPAIGVLARAYFKVPLGKRRVDAPYAGLALAVSRQDRDIAGIASGPRRDVDAADLRMNFSGRRSLALGGVSLDDHDRWEASGAGRKHSTLRTVAFVAGGLLLAGAATFAYLVHEAEKNSD